jgi:uncharacterized membrane protein YphA (DoxX/SURF4 family)
MVFSNNVVRTLALVLRIALGAVFVYAAYVKLREPWELFALAINSYQLLPLKGVELVARTLPWFELAIGLMLIVGRGLRVSATVTSLLLLVFFGLIVRAYAKGMEISCGCFGNDEPLTWLTMLRDGTILAGSLLLTFIAFRPRRTVA